MRQGCLLPGVEARQRRGNDNVQVPVPEHLGGRISLAVRSDFLDELVHDLEPKLLVRLLAAFKPQLDADFEIIAEELDGVVPLHRQVVRVNGRRELQLFHPAGGLLPMGVLVALGLLVEEFAVVDDAANGGRGVGGNLDQVQTFDLRQAQGIVERHHAKLLFLFVQDADLPGANFPVPAVQGFSGAKRARREGAAQIALAGCRLIMQKNKDGTRIYDR